MIFPRDSIAANHSLIPNCLTARQLVRNLPMNRLLVVLSMLVAFGCSNKPIDKARPTSKNAKPQLPHKNKPPQLAASAVTKKTLSIGQKTVVQSDSSIGRFRIVFEDDTDSGYMYALDTEIAGNPIVDTLHIYNVQSITVGDAPSELHIIWSGDGMKAALFIDSYPHAIYNFSDGIGCCRSGFPPPADKSKTHEWDESQMTHFFAKGVKRQAPGQKADNTQ